MRAYGIALLFITTPLFASQAAATHAALATSSPIATRAGLNILERGGNAIDAAVAVALVLGVAQPDATGIGGGGSLVYFDAKSGAVWTLDFREVSPIEATLATKLRAGTPGFLAGLDAMHAKFGTMQWRDLVAPSIALARESSKPELATTLTRIAEAGARDFYRGALAEHFITAVQAAGGAVGHRDLREYEAVWRAPIRIRFGDYDIFAPSPPSSGGIVIGEVLNIIGATDLVKLGWQSPKTIHFLVEAQRRASIDAAKYISDPTNARIPYRDLLSADRAAMWRASIKPDKVTPTSTLTEPGTTASEAPHTTHFTIADRSGNVAAVTTSIGGGTFMLPGLGFPLNDALNDFSGNANAFATRKRPATSDAPTLVLKNGRAFLALGSSGGAAIPTTVLQVLINTIVFKKSLADAIAAPRYHQQALPDEIDYEDAFAPKATIDALNAMGHAVVARGTIGDVHAVMFDRGKIIAVADPRHGGAAGGY